MHTSNVYRNGIPGNIPRLFLLLPFISLICSVAYTQPPTDNLSWEKLSFEVLQAQIDSAQSTEERLLFIKAAISKAKKTSIS